MSHEPLAFLCRLSMEPPSPSDKAGDADRLLEGLERRGLKQVAIPLSVMRRLPEELRKCRYEMDVVIGPRDGGLKVIDVARENIYGLAVDIGSTNIECSLIDLKTGKKIAGTGAENPQAVYGADVLTRVQRSMTGEYQLLAGLLRDGVNALVGKVCESNAIERDEIVAMTVAGNTIMTHFFLGLDVRNIPLSPYVPAVNRSVCTSAEEIGIGVNRNAAVYVFPNSGSYVGGDIISGIVFSGILGEETPVLFIDVGTNVEITLGCRDWIMVGAGAAGPALESGVAGIGKKAEEGTISRVRIDSTSREIELEVISDTEPRGICGSGLIDLVSEMFRAGIIDQTGRIIASGSNILEMEGGKAYRIHASSETELFLSETEIRNFLLSKAAMFSFLYVFVRSVGLSFSDIKKVYIAGALGCGINPESAIHIGMLPGIPRDKFVTIGNSSLGGAEMVLVNRNLLRDVERIASMITYREMNEDAELMSILQGAMFIPHTDPEILRG